MTGLLTRSMTLFLSTLSLRRATFSVLLIGKAQPISIHALLAESDDHCHRLQKQVFAFLSTLSLRRATGRPLTTTPHLSLFLSTLSLRRATGRHQKQDGIFGISIHALLAESDRPSSKTGRHFRYFYPRSPCGERRSASIWLDRWRTFLSTLSLRRATLIFAARHMAVRVFLSTLSLRRATTSLVVIGTNCVISIHALLAESDPADLQIRVALNISIHALLAESDPHRRYW